MILFMVLPWFLLWFGRSLVIRLAFQEIPIWSMWCWQKANKHNKEGGPFYVSWWLITNKRSTSRFIGHLLFSCGNKINLPTFPPQDHYQWTAWMIMWLFTCWHAFWIGIWKEMVKVKSQGSKCSFAKIYDFRWSERQFQSILSEMEKGEYCNLIMIVNSTRFYSLLVQNLLLDYFVFSSCKGYGNRAANTLLV